jgi:hypothetical protein
MNPNIHNVSESSTFDKKLLFILHINWQGQDENGKVQITEFGCSKFPTSE